MENKYAEAQEAVRQSSEKSSVYIGCDSQCKKIKGKWYANYSTVIILHMDSSKGGKIFYSTERLPDFGHIRPRLMQEVQFAVEAAEAMIEVIGDRHLEIHLDLNGNPNHKSNVAVKEALGWVRGVTGIDAKIKPYSFAASHAADHACRNKFEHTAMNRH